MDIIYDYFPALRVFIRKGYDPFVNGPTLRVGLYDYFPALRFFFRNGYDPFVCGPSLRAGQLIIT